MKKVILFVVTLALCLAACGAEPSTETEPAQAVSAVSPAHCFLCGDGAKDLPYWGQNNVGIISLNTFEIMPIEINRYDDGGALIEKRAGYKSNCGFHSDKGGFSAAMFADTDRSHASGIVILNDDNTLTTETAAAFLCQSCLDTILPEHSTQYFGAGIIHFAEREIHLFHEKLNGFYLDNFFIHCYWSEERDAFASIQVFYCPPRYPEDG